MAAVLVLVEHDDGTPKKVTYEMLAKARQLGEPAAVFVGDGLDAARDGLGRHGAATVYVAAGEGWTNRLTLPVADALAAAADRAEPAAVLVSASPAGKDAGARLAARKGWGMLADITDLDGDLVATQSVFGGHHRPRQGAAPGSPGAYRLLASVPRIRPATTSAADLSMAGSALV